ncbi:DUF2279 domain-containing protein [Flavobacterium sp.]
MNSLKSILLFIFFWSFQSLVAQGGNDIFLKPADSLNVNRRSAVIISESIIASVTLVGLNQLWYADYPKSDFHFINDNADWLQMDKIGHTFSSYHLGKIGADALKWSGVSEKNQLIYGATLGLAFLTTVEVFDGYSANWGASFGDVIANVSGTGLYVSQELLWKEQRITPKFSFHTTHYAALRPDVLGSSVNEQILKDYNGQTYWLSCNVQSFFTASKVPKWLNLAFGYGAEGMITGSESSSATISLPNKERFRQFYLSLDVDLTKIETKSHFLKTILTLFNTIKIPAPTFEISSLQGFKFHGLYF